MVIKYKQENGFSVLLEPVAGVVSASVGLWVKTGSRDEALIQHGYAHFVEHMLFKGTENFSAKEIAQEVDRVGGQHNAATNREYTCYYINIVSEYLELAIKILADMFYNSVFAVSEIEKEKNVVIEEIRMSEDSPDEFVHDLFLEKMLADHPLSHSILGSIENIQNTKREDLFKFYKDNYTNDNVLLAVAGNFDIERVKDFIALYFSKKQSQLVSLEKFRGQVLKKDNNFHINKKLEQVHFCLGTEGFKRNDKYRWTLYVLNTILGGSMSSRLFQNIREREGLCYSIYSFHSSFIDNGIFGIYCATSPDNFKKAVDLILRECRTILNNKITSSELEDAKRFIKGNFALSIESVEVKMVQLAKNELFFGKNYDFYEIVKMIENVSLENFSEIVEFLFQNKRFSLISVGNIKEIDINDFNLKI